MEGLLGSVDLCQFVQDGLVNSHDKRKDKIALYIMSSTLIQVFCLLFYMNLVI